MTVAEYLDFEDAAESKHEFDDGVIVDMSGGSYESSQIEMNLHRELSIRLKGKPCLPHGSNLKVKTERSRSYRYPDALIVCGPPEFDPDDKRKHTITNPRAVFEILSPSMEKRDRTTKFDDYRSIDGFAEYVLISQTEPRVESYFRTPDGTWQFDVSVGLETTAVVKSVGIELPLAELYAGVTFPPPDPADAAPTDG
jgi:Uma2 family endonuclease